MGRPKKPPVQTNELAYVEKKYIDLCIEKLIEKTGQVTEKDVEFLAEEVKKPVDIIKGYINLTISKVETKEVDVIPVNPQSEMIRSTLSPREGMTMMSGGISEFTDKNPANYQLNKSKLEPHIFRGNRPTKRS
jgi:hypothetical protein